MSLIRRLFAGGSARAEAPAADGRVLAVAALLVEAARADDHYTADERRLIERLLVADFGVKPENVADILTEAEKRQATAVDLFGFIRHAKALSPAERIKLVESLWRVILSDGTKHSWEDMLVRRVCGLLHVEDVDSGLARQRVQKELGL
jgi:uncharacterized tellurite resistance protein B-like protein